MAHNQLDNWVVYCIKIVTFSKNAAACFLWSVGISPYGYKAAATYLPSCYKNSYGNLSANTRQIVIIKEKHTQQ